MSYSIRHFCNTDTLNLVRIWNRHHAAFNWAYTATPANFESCIFAKPYFDAKDLILVSRDSQPIGYAHAAFGPNATEEDIDYSRGILAALYIVPDPDESHIASLLMNEVHRCFERRPTRDVLAIGSQDRYAFNIGLAPGDAIIGVLSRDIRLQNWISSAGYVPTRPTEVWESDLTSFRAPMDRGQIAMMRSSSVSKVLDTIDLPWWHQAALGHAESLRFALSSREKSSIIDAVDVWVNDPAISGLDGQVARVWFNRKPTAAGSLPLPRDERVTREFSERTLYLLSESMRQLQAERYSVARMIASSDYQPVISILQRLGFRPVESGLIFEKRLNAT